ncbi:hypothetical protein OC842_004830 [Tilletia horrida]|uniref:TLC domain-containing protein n=1 Tax=Tilletia horrida TaxID=155126 RepID=A0AAN6JIY7_9BASI|nr:hypothetical protein OC842_004830 [Tilletia horrida]
MSDPATLRELTHNVPVYGTLDPETIAQLQTMLSDSPLPTTPYFYHSMTFILFLILWIITLLITKALTACFGPRYTSLNFDHRRTTDIYVLNVILTTIAAIMQFAAMSAFSMDFRPWHFNIIRAGIMLISANYVFEICYRPRMRWQMLAHHVLTLFITMLSISVLYKTRDPTILLSGNLLLFLATLEQPTFIALFLYRLRFPRRAVKRWLFFSSVQTIIVKSVAALGTILVWARWQVHNRSGTSKAYDALLYIAIVALYLTQWWGAIVTLRIAESVDKRYDADLAAPGRVDGTDDVEGGRGHTISPAVGGGTEVEHKTECAVLVGTLPTSRRPSFCEKDSYLANTKVDDLSGSAAPTPPTITTTIYSSGDVFATHETRNASFEMITAEPRSLSTATANSAAASSISISTTAAEQSRRPSTVINPSAQQTLRSEDKS